MADLIAGWGFPGASRKAHYFQEGEAISVCNRWMYTGSREAHKPYKYGPDDCKACRTKTEKEFNDVKPTD